MNKFYLLPISLLLLNPGYADEKSAASAFSEVRLVSVDASKEVTLLNNQGKDALALELDSKLVEELKEEISAILQKESEGDHEQEVAASWEEQGTRARAYNTPRARQQLPQYQEELVDEEDLQDEEIIEAPRAKARPKAAQSVKAPRAQTEQSAAYDQEAQQPLENKQHVRRYPTQAPKAPRVQTESADNEQQSSSVQRQSPQGNQRPRVQAQQPLPAKTPRAPLNTVESDGPQSRRSQVRSAPKVQEDTADADFEQPVQQRKAPVRSQPSQMTEANRAPAQRKVQGQQSQGQKNPANRGVQAQRKNPQQQSPSRNSAYDRSGAYAPPAKPSAGPNSAKPKATSPQKKVAQSNSYSDDQDQDQMNMNQRRRMNQGRGMNKQDSGMNQGQNGTEDQMMVNTPARPVVQNGWDFWIMGDALLWQAVEENLTYAYTGNDTDGRRNRDLHTVDFNWDWGFRLGMGFNTPRDGWDLDLYWTHIRNNAHDHLHDSATNDIFQLWTTAAFLLPGTTAKASAHWHAHLDQVDFDLGREFYVGRHLTIRPYVGARSTWLFQEYDVELRNTANVEQEADLKNRFWGFGFVAGMDTDWLFGYGFSLYGEADMSILLGFHDVNEKGTREGSRIWHLEKSFRVGRAIMDLGLGIKWADQFYDDRYGLTLKVGYEYHLYFDQNQFILTNGSDNFEIFSPVNGNLIYQGVIGSIQIDF